MTHSTSPEPGYACMVKLCPPRPTFAFDANERERTLMEQHAAYWRAHIPSGLVVAFGPVLHPDGAFGVGLLRAADATVVQDLLANDPAINGGIGLVAEIYPMAALVSTP